jgi:hypothetical protein
MPRHSRTGFVVVDIDSIQEVNLSFCMCQHPDQVGEPWQQLMRHELFPATSMQPHTAFTFRLLRFLHSLTLQSKVNAYDYYLAIQNRTDGAGLAARKVSRSRFLAVVPTNLKLILGPLRSLQKSHTRMEVSQNVEAGWCG